MAAQATAAPNPTCRKRSLAGPSRQASTPPKSRAAPMLIRISERVLPYSAAVLRFTICSIVTASFSSGWSLQMAPGSFARVSSDMAFFLAKTAGKDILDSVNFHSDIRRRKSRDLCDGGGVHVLQMRNHDLPVQRFELPDELRELLERSLPIDVRLAMFARRGPLDLFETHKTRVLPPLPVHIRNSGVVSYPKRPSSGSTARQTPRSFSRAESGCPAADRDAFPGRLRIPRQAGRAPGQTRGRRPRIIRPALAPAPRCSEFGSQYQ